MKQNFNQGGRSHKINPSSLNSHNRTLVVDYDTLVRTLRENFTEKKAMRALYRLEHVTIGLVKTNREIVAIANRLDVYWRRDSDV